MCRFLYLYNSSTENIEAIQQLLTDFIVNGVTPSSTLKLTEFLSTVPAVSDLEQQFEILSHVSNNHWRQFVTVFGGYSSSSTHSHLNLVCHMSVSDKRGSLPASPRNRLVYFLAGGKTLQAQRLVDELLALHGREPNNSLTEDLDDNVSEEEERILAPPPKRARKVVNLTSELMAKDIAVNLYKYPSTARNSFRDFRERVVVEGVLYWRFHSNEEDVFVLNDYCPETGGFLPFAFVHLKRFVDGVSALYTCECRIYTWLQQKCMSTSTIEDDILISGITCMHCRFMMEEFEPKILHLVDGTLQASSSINSKLLQSKCSLNNGVVQLSPPSSGTHKFSVCCKSGTGLPCSFVHLSKDCSYIFCLAGECRARRGSKKKVQYLVTDNEDTQAGILCQHLDLMRANANVWKHLTGGDAETAHADREHDVGENTDDVGLIMTLDRSEPISKVSYLHQTIMESKGKKHDDLYSVWLSSRV